VPGLFFLETDFVITSATIRKISNGFILSTTQTVDSPIGGGPVMLTQGLDQYFPVLENLFQALVDEGFDDFTPVQE
jgi:hypothetical protein